MKFGLVWVLACGWLAAGSAVSRAQEFTPGLVAANDEDGRTAQDASVFTRRNARTLNLSIPAPRGLIADRFGEPLAQNKVAYYFALEFPHFENPDDAVILAWARKRSSQAKEWTAKEWNIPDEDFLAHYKDRRWVPYVLPALLDAGEVTKYKDQLPRGLILHPVYVRHYPQKSSASHIIGYVRSKGKLPSGPINYGDPLFEETHGVAGLENIFDEQLTGEPGQRKIIFDSDGSRLLDELEKPPRVGNTLITTLNLKWQKHAESVLKRSCKRGAFVVLDIQSGEVLVLASRPYYDINVWIPTIGQEEFESLRDDPSKPMFGRAFQGTYPPASTFKPVVALTALTNNEVSQYTKIDCPAKIKIGATTFHNHSKYPDGKIDVKRALARSNNVWFYQVGIKTGAESFLSVARRLGFGSPTGLPLFGENPGLVPTNEFMKKELGRPITQGDTANFAIGQGALQGSPLQVAQAMAGIANGRVLPRLRLVRQIQDPNGGVVLAPEPEARNILALDQKAVDIVREGMKEVVHASYGTGDRGALSFCKIAAKTGTAQWVKDRELAWFAGFLPYDNPRFAFAALYEGMPDEVVSGGRNAAPMIPRFFEELKAEMKELIKPAGKALIVEEDEEEDGEVTGGAEVRAISTDRGADEGVLRAIPVEPLESTDPTEDAPEQRPGGRSGPADPDEDREE